MHEIYTCKLRSKWARLTLLFKMLLGKYLRFQVELPALRNKITQRTEKLRGGSSFRRQTYQKTLGWRQCNPDVEIRKPSIYTYFVGGQVYAWHNLCPRLWQPEPGHVLCDTGWKGIVEKIRGKAGFESGKGWGSSTERRRQVRKHRYSEELRTSCPKQGSREERVEWRGRWASLDDHSLW